MRRLLKLVLVLLGSSELKAQHNSDYIQYLFNGLLLNPAYAGSQEALNITALYRKQWIGLQGSPSTASFGAHAKLKNNKLNVGIIFINDCYGVYNHSKASLVYAYRFRLSNGHLSLGLQAGVDTYVSNWNRIVTTEKNDPGFMASSERKTLADIGFGTYYYSPRIYVGFAMPDLFHGSINKYQTAILHSGCIIRINDNFKAKPALILKYIFNSPLSAALSATLYHKDIFGLGLGYAIKTSAFTFIDLRLNDQLRFGYGYSHPVNGLKTYTSGSHEVMLRYLFRYKVEPLSTRYF